MAAMENLCKICSVNKSKYVCPRCNVPYCSLHCYQSEAHLQCSETFYKDCVEEQMKNEEVDPASKQKMMEILKRVQQNDDFHEDDLPDSDDESEEEELAARLAGVDLDDADSIWERLTADERREFEELLRSGDVTQVVPQWTPWWTYREKKQLVEDTDGNNEENKKEEIILPCPAIKTDIKPLSTICKVAPSPNVRWNMVNVLAAYTVTARVFNGDHQASAAEAAGSMTSLSANLSRNQLFDSPDTAVAAVLLAALDAVDGCDEQQLKDDVRQIVEGPSEQRQSDYVLAALSDLHSLFSQARKALKEPDKTRSKGVFCKRFPTPGFESALSSTSASCSSASSSSFTSQITKCYKKTEYYLSWAKEWF